MRLRTQLFVSSVAVAVPLALALFLVDERLRLREMQRTLAQYVDLQLASGGLERCESDPLHFTRPGPPGGRRGGAPPDGGPPPPGAARPADGPPPGRGGFPPPREDGGPYELFVYASNFEPVDPRAPALPDDLRASLSNGQQAATTYSTPDGRGIALAMRVGSADSACAIFFARMGPRPGERRDQTMALGLVVISVLAAAWVAAGPVIGRMRRLASGVRESAASQYQVPVPIGGSARDELADLAREFNTAGASVRQHLVELQTRQEMLRQFVANTTHDVALPLTVLQGHLADLEKTLAGGTPERAHVRESIEEAHYMASLLRNLSVAARLDEAATAPDRRPVDLSALVERVVARHRAVARARGVEINYAVPEAALFADTDLTLMEQIVSNLADNAVHYNREDGHVAIVLDERGPGEFVLAVVDDGPGVAEEELTNLTTRRFRGSDARTRRPEGQGLGLAIVAEAAERLSLSLRFSRPDEGGLAVEVTGPRRWQSDPSQASPVV